MIQYLKDIRYFLKYQWLGALGLGHLQNKWQVKRSLVYFFKIMF